MDKKELGKKNTELEKKVEQLEKVNLELRFKLIEQERNKVINEIRTKYPEMLGGKGERKNNNQQDN